MLCNLKKKVEKQNQANKQTKQTRTKQQTTITITESVKYINLKKNYKLVHETCLRLKAAAKMLPLEGKQRVQA